MIEYIYYDNIRWRKEKRRDYYVAVDIKITKKRLHVYIWEKYNGPIGKGFVIHHIDENKKNNDINNLTMISRSEHMRYHASNITDERRQKLSENTRINNKNRTGKVKWSDEAKKRASERMKGSGNPFYGKHHTEETKKKLRHKD